jgi:glycosyltransferase involved in cell wall biosynthesis
MLGSSPYPTDFGDRRNRFVREMPQPTVSVLVNNYNYGRFVSCALASALAQYEPRTEIIVVDDGSDDDSRAVLQAYGQRVQIVYQSNRGQAGAINAGVRASRGELICFLDADDWWAQGKLAAIIAVFEADPHVALVYHRLQPMLSDGTAVLKPLPRTLCSGNLSPRLVKSAGWWPFPLTSAIAVRRSAWEEAGDIPEMFSISADAWLVGIYPFLGRVAALPDSLGFYRIHANHWYRPADDAAMLRKRMTHWEATVDATNLFLSSRKAPRSLRLADHFPYQVASAQLHGVDPLRRLQLALQGLLFAGEPNPLRRMRGVFRSVFDLSAAGRSDSVREISE